MGSRYCRLSSPGTRFLSFSPNLSKSKIWIAPACTSSLIGKPKRYSWLGVQPVWNKLTLRNWCKLPRHPHFHKSEYNQHIYIYIHIYWGFIKKLLPFNHIFGGDRILRAWYRGIKNAGPRKRAQGRAQDIPYQSIPPYHHGIWRIFIECGKNPTRARARKGEAQGVLSYQKATGIFDK